MTPLLQKNRNETPAALLPEWIRLPRPGESEPRTGLSRSVLFRLCSENKVKSISLRDTGKKRGTRLVSLPSLLSYLSSLAEKQGA